MANHWAIAIGIGQYNFMEPLKYSSRDVTALQEYLIQTNFSSIYCFSDHSPNILLNGEVTLSSQPTLANLKHFLELQFATPFLQPEDTLWFFFIGHGWHFGNQDYLMPADGHPDCADSTALTVDAIADWLSRSGTEKIVLVLDACHTETHQFGQGFGTDPKGVVTLFSTDYGQISRQIDLLKHGSFTYALLDGFKDLSRYQNASIEHLYKFLKESLPKLNRYGLRPPQSPRLQVDYPLSAAMIQLPQARAQKQNWLQRLLVPNKKTSAIGSTTPTLTTSDERQPNRPWAIAGLTGAAICISLLGYAVLQRSNGIPFLSPQSSSPVKPAPARSASQPTKTETPENRVASTRLVPNQSDQETGLGQVASERLPQPGVYYTTNPQFAAFRREIGKSGDRLCIKLVNSSPNPSKAQGKVIVSSVSRRPDGFYIDATGQKLSSGRGYSELSDGKLLWQRQKTGVDESGLMGECLTARAKYARSYQTNGSFDQ